MNSRRRGRTRGAAALVVATIGLSACTTDAGTPTATDGVVQVIAPGDRQQVKPFRGELLDGVHFDTTSLAGKGDCCTNG